MVLRLPPLDLTFPGTDLSAQATVQNTVAAAGIPTPAPTVFVSDVRWIGTPFLVMPRVSGFIPGRRRSSTRRSPAHHLRGSGATSRAPRDAGCGPRRGLAGRYRPAAAGTDARRGAGPLDEVRGIREGAPCPFWALRSPGVAGISPRPRSAMSWAVPSAMPRRSSGAIPGSAIWSLTTAVRCTPSWIGTWPPSGRPRWT